MRGDSSDLYPNVPSSSGHRQDMVTYVHYAGPVPGTTPGQLWYGWDQPITRAGFAPTLWQALYSHFGFDPVP